MPLTHADREKYQREGFIILRKAISDLPFEGVEEALLTLLRKVEPSIFSKYEKKGIMGNLEFHRDVIELRERNPRAFGAVYDSMHTTAALAAVAGSAGVIGTAAYLLGVSENMLSSFPNVLRMDVPKDARNALDWHQDFLTEEKNWDCSHGVNVWAPLLPIDPDSGALRVCVGSHGQRYENNIRIKRDGFELKEMTSKYSHIDENIVAKFKQEQATYNRGDVIFFNMNLVHKSGENISPRVRFTALCRFFRLDSPSYVYGKPSLVQSQLSR